MTSSGSEAVMGALRLARAATGREVVVKVAGGYHGAIDGLLAEAGSGLATMGVPSSAGVTAAATAATRIVPYNDAVAAERALRGAAAMIVEPVAGNMGVVPPAQGYLAGLRSACDRTGALLVLDEVITGFRVAPGGAQERYGVRADITCLGKVIGGGLPVGAFGGRAEVMRELAPEGPCYQAGTLSGNPLATAAGLAVLGELARPGVYARLEESGAALEAAIRDSGAPVSVNRVGSMLTPFFREGPVTDHAAATGSDTRGLRPVRPGAPSRRRLSAAVPVRGVVHGTHARRGGARRHPRGPRPGRRGAVRTGARPRAGPRRPADRAGGRAAAGAVRLPTARRPPGRRPRPDPGGLPPPPRRRAPPGAGRSPAVRSWRATTATPTGWCGSRTRATSS